MNEENKEVVELKTIKDFKYDSEDTTTWIEIKESTRYDFLIDEYQDGSVDTCNFIPINPYENPKFIKISKLKKEAINWLREDKKVIERLHPDDVSTWTIAMRCWMKRFNITEEDLK